MVVAVHPGLRISGPDSLVTRPISSGIPLWASDLGLLVEVKGLEPPALR